MAKFRKKPVVIEAEQFHYDAANAADLRLKYALVQDHSRDHIEKTCFIQTLEGRMAVSDGDWIITGVNGERYPCKPDIFAKTYEAVEPEPEWCDQCPHPMHLHNPDGSCGCGINCAERRKRMSA